MTDDHQATQSETRRSSLVGFWFGDANEMERQRGGAGFSWKEIDKEVEDISRVILPIDCDDLW